MTADAILDQIRKLPVSDRLRLLGEIWSTIGDDPDEPRLTAAEKRELDRRLERIERDPGYSSPWDDVKARLHRGRP
jgi:putative addiction module component (TIGR02574 family)